MTDTDGRVRRRRVFYIPGYDPFPPRRYREIYRREATAQAKISGYEISTRRASESGSTGWQVSARMDGHEVVSDVTVLVWSDIVRTSMGQGLAATYGQLSKTVFVYVASGAIFRIGRLRKGPTTAALYPIISLVVQVLVAFGVSVGVELALRTILPAGPWVVSLLAATACFLATLWGFRRVDGRVYVHYLMHDYAHAAGEWGAYPDDLWQRLQLFGDQIAAALNSNTDEVLIVGHSSGAHLGVSVLAQVIRDGRVPSNAPALGLLTLGHVVPMVSFLPRAKQLRRDLHDLSRSDALTWVDVTAPGDGCAFALCDPVSVTGVAPAGKRWPLVISAAFTQTLSPARWRELRWKFFRLHFQYLCAFDRPGDYDYFAITAGPKTLASRFSGRVPSPSRIETPMSRFRSMETRS